MLFDSHAHVDHLKSAEDLARTLERARAAGVERILAVGGSPEANRCALAAAERFPDRIRAAVGFDRYRAAELMSSPSGLQAALDTLRTDIDRWTPVAPASSAADRDTGVHQDASPPLPHGVPGVRIAAVGEIGLDFHYAPETGDAQVELFRNMLALATEKRLPVVVHSREADAATLEALRGYCAASGAGVVHCFTGGWDFARHILDLGFFISFSGILTFRNAAALRDVARRIPEDRLLIETDSPFLAPVPLRGSQNEPAFLVHVAEALAEVRGCPPERLAAMTTANAQRLLGEADGLNGA